MARLRGVLFDLDDTLADSLGADRRVWQDIVALIEERIPGLDGEALRCRCQAAFEGHYRELAKRVPVGRVAEASEFADLVAFLASERASYITGTAINFDGGMSSAV